MGFIQRELFESMAAEGGMRFAPEGWWGVIACAFIAGTWIWLGRPDIAWIWGIPAALWMWFCRHPRRYPPPDPDLWVAPADGRVCVCDRQPDGRWRIGIFMQLWDVHVNRAPQTGWVVDQLRQRGRFRPAYQEGVERQNACLYTYLHTDHRPWTIVQIVGILARRIRTWIRPGMYIRRGDPIGIILLGSRVDVVLPVGVHPLVQVGTRVRAGETAIARGVQHDAYATAKTISTAGTSTSHAGPHESHSRSDDPGKPVFRHDGDPARGNGSVHPRGLADGRRRHP